LFLVWQFLKHGSSNETWSFLPVFLIVAAVIYFVLPRVEVFGINPEDPTGAPIVQGLAVRGYGLMLLTAIVAGVSIVMSRCEKIGVTKDQITQLAFWMMLCGIAGARVFYVVQKSNPGLANGRLDCARHGTGTGHRSDRMFDERLLLWWSLQQRVSSSHVPCGFAAVYATA